MDNFNNRDGEEDIFAIMRDEESSGAEDGSQFLNESGTGMELELMDEAQPSTECDDDLQIGGPKQSGEVY